MALVMSDTFLQHEVCLLKWMLWDAESRMLSLPALWL